MMIIIYVIDSLCGGCDQQRPAVLFPVILTQSLMQQSCVAPDGERGEQQSLSVWPEAVSRPRGRDTESCCHLLFTFQSERERGAIKPELPPPPSQVIITSLCFISQAP